MTQFRMSSSVLKALSLVAVLGAIALPACDAFANGRFPNAEQLREIAPGSLVVSGTYGLLVSANERDFQFVCESALFGKTLMGSWVDPLLEVLPDGTILSGSLNGLRVSRDHGCSFQSDWSLPHDPSFIPPDPSATGPTGTVVDLCPAYDATHGMVALTTVTKADGTTLEHRLYHTVDGAKTWSELGMPIPTSMVRVVLTVDVAPSDPTHIYVSGNLTGQSVVVSSEDSGATWTPHTLAIDDSDGIGGLYIAAISPSDPKRVYLRVNRQSQADDGSTTWDDSLLVSDDEGATARDVLRKQGALLGFALSPDGSTVVAGYGDPVVAPIVANPDDVGLYAASSADLGFTQKISSFYASCLRWAADGLFACAKENDPLAMDPTMTDFHVGVFTGTGVPSALSDFTALTKLEDLRGPMPLASGLPSSCEAEWTMGDPASPGQASVCTSLNACDGSKVALSPGAVICGESTDAGAAASGGSSSGGANAGDASAGANPGGGTLARASGGGAGTSASSSSNSSSSSKSSSGCSLGVEPYSLDAFWALLALGSSIAGRRITRRR